LKAPRLFDLNEASEKKGKPYYNYYFCGSGKKWYTKLTYEINVISNGINAGG